MNRGVIVGFFTYVINSFSEWFDASLLGKIGRAVGRLWGGISKNSFFTHWFTGASDKLTCRDSSAVYGLFKAVGGFLKKIGRALSSAADKSAIISGLRWYFDGFFTISTAHYGVFAIAAAVSYSIMKIASGGFLRIHLIAGLVVLIVSAILLLVNLSLSAMMSGSGLVRAFFSFLSIDVPSADTPQKDVTLTSGAVFALLGIAFAALSFAFQFVYAAVIAFAVVFVCAVIYNFRLGAYAALIALPFAPTMSLVGLMLLSLASLLREYAMNSEFSFRRTALDIPIIFLLAVMLISTVTSFAVGSSVKIYMVYFVFIMGYFVITNAFSSFNKLLPVLVLMLVSALAVAAYGIYQHIFGFAEGTTWTDTDMFEDIATRVVSTFDNPNVLGEYLLLLIPLCAAMFLSVKKGFAKAAHLAITAALCVCMIYTYSRGNWIGLIFAAVVFILFYDTRFVWLGVIAVLLAPAVMSQSVISRFTSIGDTKDTSTSYRVYIWMGTLAMLKDYWLCGIGLGSDAFNMIYPHYSYAGIVAPHSHNLYLQLLAENGIMGLAVFLVIVFLYFRSVISRITKLKRGVPKAVITALAAGVFGYLVQGMFDNVWYNYRVFFMFFAVLALTMAAVNVTGGRKRSD